MNQKGFVLSSQKFDSIEGAERVATGYFNAGQLKQDCKMFRVVEEYRPKIKFIKVK